MKMELITETGKKNVGLCYQFDRFNGFSAFVYGEDDIVYRIAQSLAPNAGLAGYVYVTPAYNAVGLIEKYGLGTFMKQTVNIKGTFCPVFQFHQGVLDYYVRETQQN